MVPVTVPFLRFPETALAFAVPETVPLAVPETELEFAVRYALSAEKILEPLTSIPGRCRTTL